MYRYYLKAGNFLKDHQNNNDYPELRERLNFLILVSPYEQHLIKTLRQQVRMKRIPPVVEIIVRSWLTDPARITPIQRRLIESSLARRNRIVYAQRSLKREEQSYAPQVPRVNIPTRFNLDPQIGHDIIEPDLDQSGTLSVPSREVQSTSPLSIVMHSVSMTTTYFGSVFDLLLARLKKRTSAVTNIRHTSKSHDYPRWTSEKGCFQCPYCGQMLPEEYRSEPKWWLVTVPCISFVSQV